MGNQKDGWRCESLFKICRKSKKKNLPMIERDYFSRILGIDLAMFHLGYKLEKDGKRAEWEDGVGGIEYMHYKAIKR